MKYKYKNIEIALENDEIYWLWDIISFALDYDEENHHEKLTDEKRLFAKRLTNILNEMRY